MKFSTFLVEEAAFKEKPRVRANPDGSFSLVSAPKKKRSPPKKKMVARELYPHIPGQQMPATGPAQASDAPLAFNKKEIGKVARPQQQMKAGEKPQTAVYKTKKKPAGPPAPIPTPKTPISPQQQAHQQALKQMLVAKHKPGASPAPANVSSSNTPDKISNQILAIAQQAAASNNPQQIDQILSMLKNARHADSNRIPQHVQMRDEAAKEANRIWRQSMRGTPEFKSLVLQNLTNMMKTGGRR